MAGSWDRLTTMEHEMSLIEKWDQVIENLPFWTPGPNERIQDPTTVRCEVCGDHHGEYQDDWEEWYWSCHS